MKDSDSDLIFLLIPLMTVPLILSTMYQPSPEGEKHETQTETVPSVADPETPAYPDYEASVQQVPAPLRIVRMKVTAYCLCEICCGKWSVLPERKTSIGDDAKIYDGVAADPKLIPYRTRLEIPGIGIKEVDDTGGGMRQSAKKGIYHIDVRMPSHSEARGFGVKWLEVKILN